MSNLEQFRTNAPLIDPYNFGRYVQQEVLGEAFDQSGVDIYLFGSFVNPNTAIDESGHRSDIDVFVTVEEWNTPVADTGIFLFASETTEPESYREYCDQNHWGGAELPDREWDCDVDEAWDRLEPETRTALAESAQMAVFRNEQEQDAGTARTVDLFIGSHRQFDRTAESGARLHVWPTPEQTE